MTHLAVDATASSNPDVFDPAEALARVCDDLDLLAELAELFAENRARLLEELSRAVAEGDPHGIDRAAHALKGSISTFSTRKPYELARELEFCGKEGRLEQAPLLFDALTTYVQQLEQALAAFLAGHHLSV
jgi:two-component system sensor histidine kinase/response regulator